MSLRAPAAYNQYRGNRRLANPASEPVTAAEVKDQLRITGTDDDALIELYIQSARELCEELTGLALITQTWKLTLDHWPGGAEDWWDGVRTLPISELRASARHYDVVIPRYPLQSIQSITADDTAVTVADVFITDTQQMPGRLVIKRGATWPTVLDRANGIEISYTAGYGSDASSVPAALRLALMQMASYMYEHRGDCDTMDAYKASGANTAFERYKAAKL